MEANLSKLTVLFEEPFWIGIYERECGGSYEACKITFGAEPKDYEVYEYVLCHWANLRFSPGIAEQTKMESRINPKRLQREIKRQLQDRGVGTKAQQALKIQQEQGKLERKVRSKEQRETEKERKYELHCKKQKEKHRGR